MKWRIDVSAIKRFLVYMWVLLIPFQDSALQGLPIGFLGASPAFVPLLILISMTFIESIMKKEFKITNRKFFISSAIIGYAIVITAVYLLIYGGQSYGTNLITKSINITILTIMFLFPIFCIEYRNTYYLKVCVFMAFFITVSGVILCDVFQLGTENSIVHFYGNFNMRPRGLTFESSWLSAMVITMSLLAAHFSKTKSVKILFMVLMILILAFCRSKGGILTLLIVVLSMLFFFTKVKSVVRFSIILVTITMIGAIYILFGDLLVIDLVEYTSIATRIGLIITTIITVAYNPLGVGFSGFIPAINKYIPLSMEYIEQTFENEFNFTELLSYVGDTASSVSTKTFLTDYVVFFGIPFLICFTVFNYRLLVKLKEQDKIFLLIAVAYSYIALCTYISGVGFYNISMVYGVAYYEAYRKKSISGCT